MTLLFPRQHDPGREAVPGPICAGKKLVSRQTVIRVLVPQNIALLPPVSK